MLDLFEKLINEHGSSAILRERLILARDEHEVVLKENADLREKLSKAVADVSDLQKKLESYLAPDNFVEYKGALFRRKPEGGYADSVCCPRCKHLMSSSSMGFNYFCKPCDHRAGFASQQLGVVLAELLHRDEQR